MNQYACTNSQGGLRFTTAFLAEFDPVTRTLTTSTPATTTPFCGAAHGAVEYLVAGGLPLGIRREAVYESGSAVLRRATGW